ncbi:hypothetical protein C2S52_011437 [Perilla frutescens var. hirtella]|nr:hypothetical protein C2S52_011437 [Perilla frutescens var. hirtella]KAH6785908.1 hypothetical protein C2S51_038363 [Perilla frutescens var. frutescens]
MPTFTSFLLCFITLLFFVSLVQPHQTLQDLHDVNGIGGEVETKIGPAARAAPVVTACRRVPPATRMFAPATPP